ncbi:prolyl 4-hydroxylase subunit alpha-2-like [Amphiura filiformis]|uniref:prolyl 4-hydroxylase subunit alpha-2-like n=1 Tax=Amphiura filiformis TaxID=82378 RepID=UPI003B2284CD
MLRKSTDHPTKTDAKGAERALIRLQETYQYTGDQLATGELIPGQIPVDKLTAHDFVNIGLNAWEDGNDSAQMWLETGRSTSKSNSITPSLSTPMLQGFEILASIAYQHRQFRKSLEIIHEILTFDPENAKANHLKETIMQDEERNLYNSLCRGDHTAIKSLPSKWAKCQFVHRNNPNLFIQPIKEEVVSLSPPIVLFHDIVTDSEIEHLLTKARNSLTTGGAKINRKDYRTNSVSWIDSERVGDPIWTYLRRIQHYTGLSTDVQHREWIQVANYGIGGHYYPHYDGEDKDNENKTDINDNMGQRIATVLTYLTDVKSGGATVFLHDRKHIQPSKGTAVFWYNYHRNGKLDHRTKHAACPVVMGTKWAANLWVREFGQEFLESAV